jgi:hypothetical protein
MALPLEKIEEFFAARFAPVSPGPGRELHQFDGYAHWCVLYDDRQCLFITADRDAGASAFPVVELAAFCLRVSTSHAVGVGPVLILHPNDTEDTSHHVALTKTKAGRISLSTSVGEDTRCREAEPFTAPNGDPATRLGNSGVTERPPSVS